MCHREHITKQREKEKSKGNITDSLKISRKQTVEELGKYVVRGKIQRERQWDLQHRLPSR